MGAVNLKKNAFVIFPVFHRFVFWFCSINKYFGSIKVLHEHVSVCMTSEPHKTLKFLPDT